ncbi:hypothetical protein BH23CHL1_BH23CHL1_15840 [soil metagenome]
MQEARTLGTNVSRVLALGFPAPDFSIRIRNFGLTHNSRFC